MSDDPKKDDEKRDEVLKRMLGTKSDRDRKPGKLAPRPAQERKLGDEQ